MAINMDWKCVSFTKHLPISKWIIKKQKKKKVKRFTTVKPLETEACFISEVKVITWLHVWNEQMEKKTNHSHSAELSTTVFLQVTAKGLSCLIWATAEIFLPLSWCFVIQIHPFPHPCYLTIPHHQTINISHHLLSPVSNQAVHDTSFWGFTCIQSHTQPFLGKQNTDGARAMNTVHDLSAQSWHLYTRAKHASF